MTEAEERQGETEQNVASTSGIDGTVQRLRELRVSDRPCVTQIARKHDAGGPEEYMLSLDEKVELALSVAEECIDPTELRNLLDKKQNPVAYDGFEPSGRMHIAQGVMKALNVNKLTKCGVTFKFWVADIFAQMNNKMSGDLKKIQVTGKYFVEIWKAIGMESINDKVLFLNASEEINSNPHEYNALMLDIARSFNLNRIKKCTQIMGREESDDLSAAQIFYPCMQCADIFFLKADICQLGMDQRKVNMLAREYCDKIKRKLKPVILSHEMLPGLLEGQEKMSKSDPNSAIFMEDSKVDVERKIKKAFCPPNVVQGNPCLKYIQLIILPWSGSFTVTFSRDGGHEKVYKEAEELHKDYESGVVHPSDLKPALSAALNTILQPVRDHFENDPNAKELLKKVKSYKVTK